MKEFDEKYIKEDLLKDKKNHKENVFNENLEIELNDRENIEKYGYDFIPRINHWTSVDEQKIKVNEVENITDK